MRWLLLVCALAGCDVVLGLKQERPDAGTSDAFDPATGCPSNYVAISPGLTTRYRFLDSEDYYATHANTCLLDDAHHTHLALVTTMPEGFAIQAYLATGMDTYWVGLEQMPATEPDANWRWLDGSPIDPPLWGAFEPDDGVDKIENQEEERGLIKRGVSEGLFLDAPQFSKHRAICECDDIVLR